MREHFKAYYQLTVEELETLWKKALISVDANVLLNLYRYSPRTRAQLLKLLHAVEDRLWLTHQAGLEFHRNRLKVIFDQRDTYEKLLEAFRKIVNQLKSTRGHPFVSPDLEARLEKDLRNLEKEFSASIKELDALQSADEILDEVTKIFAGRVGEPFTDDEIDTIAKEGADRYKRRIPPGFEDQQKPEGERYGDLILWKQLISKVSGDKRPVILITDDSKEDWWLKVSGRTIGPLPTLREEITAATGELFHMYPSDLFMEYAAKYLSQAVESEAIKEVKDTQQQLHEQREKDLRDVARVLREAILSGWAEHRLSSTPPDPGLYDVGRLSAALGPGFVSPSVDDLSVLARYANVMPLASGVNARLLESLRDRTVSAPPEALASGTSAAATTPTSQKSEAPPPGTIEEKEVKRKEKE